MEDDGDGGGPNAQFHSNEAISAVADDGFLGEEEDDDDYEDLYNDVNVGEGFLQSLNKNEDLGFRNGDVDLKMVKSEPEETRPMDVTMQPMSSLPKEATVKVEHRSENVPITGGDGEDMRQYGGEDMRQYGGGDSRVTMKTEMGGDMMGFRPPGMPMASVGGGGLRVQLGQSSNKVNDLVEQNVNVNVGNQGIVQQSHGGGVDVGNAGMIRPVVGGNMNLNGGASNYGVGGGSGGGGGSGTFLFVGDLHWWTTDAEIEGELCKYGLVKEVKFFDEKASGKSKGYCQAEFYDPAAATACKEGMNGHMFNGRACVVAFASPYSIKRMGEAQMNKNQQTGQGSLAQVRRGPNEAGNKPIGSNMETPANIQGGDRNFQGGDRNFQGGDRNFQGGDSNRGGYGRGNWGRGNGQGMGRGPVGQMRNNRMGGRGMMGNGGNGFGQGMGANPPMMHPQAMMGQGFDPAFGGPMGMMGNYGGFPGGPTPPFSGLMSSFPPVGNVGLSGVAPHVNPNFFGRGMPMNGMGMMPTSGVDGSNMGMWQNPNAAGWAGEEHGGGRGGESSYGEDAASDQYGEVSHERAGYSMKEKDRDWSGTSDRRHRDDREPGYGRDLPREKDISNEQDLSERRPHENRERDPDREHSRDHERDRDREREREKDRDRHKEERDKHGDRHRHREPEQDDEWGRGKSSRTHRSRTSHEDDHRSRSRDADYGKRRRVTPQ